MPNKEAKAKSGGGSGRNNAPRTSVQRYEQVFDRLPVPMALVFAVTCLFLAEVVEGWVSSSQISHPQQQKYDTFRRRQPASESESSENGQTIPEDIQSPINVIAIDLWGGQEAIDQVVAPVKATSNHRPLLGEMPLPPNIPYKERYAYFLGEAERGDARAQHSTGLLLWSGFGSVCIDPGASAKWHSAAAIQGNVDGLAVLGGCLRTGTGVGKNKNVALGLKCIDYAASAGNPSGINKKAALLESNDDWFGAANLYEQCYSNEASRKNALLLFNLGYCLVCGNGMEQNVAAGEALWKDAVDMAPDEGSEEAAFFLYQQFARDDESEAQRWLEISAELGYQEAMDMI